MIKTVNLVKEYHVGNNKITANDNINFEIKRGEKIAFIGSTGSGKSTLINLIPRFYDATEGEILLDGINVKDYDSKTLNNKLGYVSQTATLFKDSVKNNVALGIENVDEDKVWESLEVACGRDFIEEKDEGLEEKEVIDVKEI